MKRTKPTEESIEINDFLIYICNHSLIMIKRDINKKEKAVKHLDTLIKYVGKSQNKK